jgi:hypothetical protein
VCVIWVEDTLSKSDEFKWKNLQERFKPNVGQPPINIVLLDVEEQPIELPKY